MPAHGPIQFGMVNKVVPREELREATTAWAAKLAGQNRLGNWLTKQAVNHVEELRGKRTAMDAVFHMHHFAHAQNDLCTGNSIGGVSRQIGCGGEQEGVRRKLMGDPLHTLTGARLGCRLPVIQTAMGWVAEA
jgi:hypothetical protein